MTAAAPTAAAESYDFRCAWCGFWARTLKETLACESVDRALGVERTVAVEACEGCGRSSCHRDRHAAGCPLAPRRFPAIALLDAIDGPVHEKAKRLGVTQEAFVFWRRGSTLSAAAADLFAVRRLGIHPSQIWPDWA